MSARHTATEPDGVATEPPAEPRPPHRWLIFAIVSVGVLMGGIDSTIVATALHSIDTSLRSSVAWGAWTITVYQLGVAMAQPVMGRISDQFGRKRVYVACVAIFTLSSLGCCLAPSIYLLLPFRFLQALGGGGFMPSATGIVSDVFKGDRDRAIGMFTSIFPLGSMAGPIFGGIIITYWSWREIFLVNLPLGALLIVLAIRILPHSEPRPGARPDIQGIIVLTAFMASLMTAITLLGTEGRPIGEELSSPGFLASIACFAVLFAAFGRHLKRTPQPIIPLALLRSRTFATMNVLNLVYGGCVVGFAALVPLYAADRYHIQSLQAGTLLTARSAGAVLVAGATSLMLRRIGYRLPMAVGFSFVVAGLVLLALSPPIPSVYAWLVIGTTLMGIGNGMAAPATNNAVLGLAPGDIAAIAGLRGSFRQMGGILAISVVTALVTRSPGDPGMEFAHCLIVFAILIVCVSPLIYTVPERQGDW